MANARLNTGIALVATLVASPALAAGDVFFSLANTDFVVLLAFLLFVGVLIYFKVPGRLAEMLDNRADGIRNDLAEARALREEAQTLLASYERKQAEVRAQADRIVEHAREEARIAAEETKASLAGMIERRVKAAEDQIASARDAAVRNVRDQAARVAVEAAAEVATKQVSGAKAAQLIDESIKTVAARLN